MCWLSHNKKFLNSRRFQNAAGWRCDVSYPSYRSPFPFTVHRPDKRSVMTGKPLSSRYSVVDSHSSTSSAKQKPTEAGFYMKVVKLTDKPLSFRCSVVDSHRLHYLQSKTPPGGGVLKVVKLTGKPLSFRCSVVDSHSSTLSTKQNPAWWRGS